MSSNNNKTFKEYDEENFNNGSTSTMSDEDWERLGSLLESMEQVIAADTAFADFYDKCFVEADDLAAKKLGGTVSHPTGASCAEIANLHLANINKKDAFVVKEIAPKLHRYIREHGIPRHFPMHVKSFRSFCEDKLDSSVPFTGREIGARFLYCAPSRNYRIDRNFKHYFVSSSNDCVMLKANLSMPTYKPSWSADYDKEFSQLTNKANALEKKIQSIKSKLDSAEHDLDLFSGNLLFGAIGAVFKAIIPLLKGLLFGGLALFACHFVADFIFNTDLDSMATLGQAIVWLVVGAVFLGFFITSCEEHEVFDFISDYSFRRRARKEKAAAKKEISSTVPGLEKELSDLRASDAYRAAERRNTEAYEADCRLAEEWQREWYEQCKTESPQDFI